MLTGELGHNQTKKQVLCYRFSIVPGVYGNEQAKYLDIVKQMLTHSLQDKDHPQVWFEAVKATTAFLTTNCEDHAIVYHFKDLLPGVIQVSIIA